MTTMPNLKMPAAPVIKVETIIKPNRYGNEDLYRQIQEDALTIIESLGVKVSEKTADHIMSALDPGEVGHLIYVPEAGRVYITRDVIEAALDRVRQGFDYWPKGFGTGGMAAYLVDASGPRMGDFDDLRRLIDIVHRTDEITFVNSSFNPGRRSSDTEIAVVDTMVLGLDGKLAAPTVRTNEGIDNMATRFHQGYKVANAMSIISNFLTVSEEMADPFIRICRAGVPHLMNSMPIAGLTAPYSMTSLATLAQADALFGLVLAQLIKPGIKCVHAGMPSMIDIGKRDMPMMFGSRSNTLVNILMAELNIWLGLPTYQSACPHSRNSLDEDAVKEAAATYTLVNRYNYHGIRHMFGFASQLNDFCLDNMEREIELYRQTKLIPVDIPEVEPAVYDPDGLEAIFDGITRNDFRNLDHTLRNTGKSFLN